MGKSNLICPKIRFPYRWIKYGVKIYKRLYEKTLRIKLGAVHVTVRRNSVTKLLYLFRNLSQLEKYGFCFLYSLISTAIPYHHFYRFLQSLKVRTSPGQPAENFVLFTLAQFHTSPFFHFLNLERKKTDRFLFIYLLKSIMFCLERLFVKLW